MNPSVPSGSRIGTRRPYSSIGRPDRNALSDLLLAASLIGPTTAAGTGSRAWTPTAVAAGIDSGNWGTTRLTSVVTSPFVTRLSDASGRTRQNAASRVANRQFAADLPERPRISRFA